jgi:hypothetical protein
MVKLSLCLIKPHTPKTYGRMEIWLHAFLTSELVSSLHRFSPVETAPVTLCVGEWAASRVSLNAVQRGKYLPLPGIYCRFINSPAKTLASTLSELRRLVVNGYSVCSGRSQSPYLQFSPKHHGIISGDIFRGLYSDGSRAILAKAGAEIVESV